MEVKMSISDIEQREFNEIDELLPTLWNEGLLTGSDCRIIATSNTLAKKKSAVFKAIMSKTEEEVAVLSEAFRNMSVALLAKKNSTEVQTTSSEEEYLCSVLPSRNPFLNNMIIKRLFGFLPLQEIKRLRLVCQEWNSAAEICLRKGSAIRFSKVFPPNTFLQVSKYSHPDLPFTSFIFSNHETSTWDVTDIENFMEKWEKNIKEVKFSNINLIRHCKLTGTVVLISNYDVTPLFINPSNITRLEILRDSRNEHETKLKIPLWKFVSLKTLLLRCCTIIDSAENFSTRIAPLSTALQSISFLRNEKIVSHINYNEKFDFSKALNIDLENGYRPDSMDRDRIFDMGENVFKVNRLNLYNIYLKNWNQAKGVVQILHLDSHPFVEKNQLKIKQLFATNCKIDLNALPETLEFFNWQYCKIYCNEPLDLPNLKKVFINVEDSQSLIYFSNCENLVELEIRDDGTFSLDCVPKSVKRITMDPSEIEFADNYIIEIDTLVLNVKSSDTHMGVRVKNCTTITAQIKAKELVIICGFEMDNDTSDIVKLVLANKQAQKILFGSDSDLKQGTPFERSDLSKFVDTISNYYQFENGFGKSITQEEFEILYAEVAPGKINPY